MYAFIPRFLHFSPDAGRLSGDVTGLCGGGPLYSKRACGFCSLPSPDTVTLSGDLTGRFGETSFCCGCAQEVFGFSLHRAPACCPVLLLDEVTVLYGAAFLWLPRFCSFLSPAADSLSGEGFRWCVLPLELVFRLRVLLSVCGLSPWGSFHGCYWRRVGLLGHRSFDLSISNLMHPFISLWLLLQSLVATSVLQHGM